MIRAIFFDLDGTLLNSAKKIPASARTAIVDYRKRGVQIFFATARSPRLDQTLNWTEEEFRFLTAVFMLTARVYA